MTMDSNVKVAIAMSMGLLFGGHLALNSLETRGQVADAVATDNRNNTPIVRRQAPEPVGNTPAAHSTSLPSADFSDVANVVRPARAARNH